MAIRLNPSISQPKPFAPPAAPAARPATSNASRDVFVSSAQVAKTVATPKYNPASDLFPQLDWLNPATYQPADPSKLSAQQPSEIQHMLDAQASRTPQQNAIAQDLAKRGTFSLWMDYASQYQKSHGFFAGMELKAKLAVALGVDGAADFIKKAEVNEKRPYQVDPRIQKLGGDPGGSSYPSGHSASAYAAATVLAEAMPDRANEFFNAAANVARSRVYMGVHFPGDVAAGARLGMKVGDTF